MDELIKRMLGMMDQELDEIGARLRSIDATEKRLLNEYDEIYNSAEFTNGITQKRKLVHKRGCIKDARAALLTLMETL